MPTKENSYCTATKTVHKLAIAHALKLSKRKRHENFFETTTNSFRNARLWAPVPIKAVNDSPDMSTDSVAGLKGGGFSKAWYNAGWPPMLLLPALVSLTVECKASRRH